MNIYTRLDNGTIISVSGDTETTNGNIRLIEGCSPFGHYRQSLIKKQVDDGIALIQDYVQPDITLDAVRAKRDTLLLESDKYALLDSVIPQGVTQQQILTYRKALRDMTESLNLSGVKSLDDVAFPTKPF